MSWHHDSHDEPVVLYSEIDADGTELRKVEEYRDGALDFADEIGETGTTQLSVTSIPSLEEINAQPEFSAVRLDAASFEEVWARATRYRGRSHGVD